MAQPFVTPVSIRRIARPGETTTQVFTVNVVPDGALVCSITGGSSFISITNVFACRHELHWLTEDELRDLPPAARDAARRDGYRQTVEIGRAGAGEPLDVRRGLHVRGEIQFTAPADHPPHAIEAALVVEGWSGNRIEVPIEFVVSDVRVDFLADPIVAHCGQAVPLPVRVTMAPNSAQTELTLEASDPWLLIPAQTVVVTRGGSAFATLQLQADASAPIGTMPGRLSIRGIADGPRSVPFEADIQPFSPAIWAAEAIAAKAAAMSEGPAGPRAPISPVEPSSGGGFVQRYSAGNIYWQRNTGAKWVYGAILTKYMELGGPAGALGYPVADERPASGGRGRAAEFEDGSIYFSSPSGAHAVRGRIREFWKSLGAEQSYLGFPTSDSRGAFSRFERGTIHVHSNDLVYDVSDARDIHTGDLQADSGAAYGWAEVMVTAAGGWTFKGSMRPTRRARGDLLMVIGLDLQPLGGPVIAFAESGRIERRSEHDERAHAWDHAGIDTRLRDNWDLLRAAPATARLMVTCGRAFAETVVSVLGPAAVPIGGAVGTGPADAKMCGDEPHQHIDPHTGVSTPARGVKWTRIGTLPSGSR